MEIEIPRLKDLTAEDFTSPDAWVSFKFERERLAEEQALLEVKQEHLRKWEQEVYCRTKRNILLCVIAILLAVLSSLT